MRQRHLRDPNATSPSRERVELSLMPKPVRRLALLLSMMRAEADSNLFVRTCTDSFSPRIQPDSWWLSRFR